MTKKAMTPKGSRPVAKQIEKPPAESVLGNGQLCEESIRLAAYWKWDAAGRPDGDGLEFWLQAEQEMLESH